jgi:hypothetical protein
MYGYGYSLYNQVPFGRGGIDPAAQAYFTATGITGATQQTAIDNLVKGLKADGLWSKMKAVYPFVTDNRNLLSYTDTFSNAYWATGGGALKTPNYATAPDGTMTACRVYNGGYFQSGGINKQVNTYAFSFYVKMTSGTSGSLRVYLDGGFSTTTINVTNSWTRVEVTKTFATIDTATSGFYVDSDVLIWQPQLELGSTATTYQPIATTTQAYIASQFKYNLVNPVDSDAAFRLVFNGGWTHSSNGATPNGTNGYADTKLVPSSVLAQNSASIGAYLRTNNTGDYCDIGSSNSPSYNSGLYLFYNITANKDFSRNNNDAGAGGTTTASSGFIVNKRTAFSDMKVIRNNSLILSNGNPTTGRSTSPILISAMNRGGTIELYSNRQTAFNFVSDGLTDTEAANLYTRVQAFQTSLSRQV